jgi:hypothetical protein
MVVYGIFDILCVVRFFPIRGRVEEADKIRLLPVRKPLTAKMRKEN